MEASSQRKRPIVKSPGAQKKVRPVTDTGAQDAAPEIRHVSRLDTLGIKLNSSTAKQAIILSEIIGKPVSRRKK